MSDLTFAKINVRVRDVNAALAYARDVLGAEVVREPETISLGIMGMVRLGGLIIEIIAPDRPDSGVAQLIEKRGEGIDSVGFYVGDINAAADGLESGGAKIVSNDGRIAWVHPRNPLSLSVELLQEGEVTLVPE
jgi:4-hydroxyphenylpyruvate dioxygenase-like putative hemolysin